MTTDNKAPESLLSETKMKNLLSTALKCPLSGAVAEVGVYKGGALISLAKAFSGVEVIGFDTFNGLPANYDGEDEIHRPGEFKSQWEEVSAACSEYKNITLVKGVFPESAKDFPEKRYSFVHLDLDQWRGTKDALEYFWPRMVPRGTIFFDDYGWRKCPGIKPLVDSWAADHNCAVYNLGSFQAYICADLYNEIILDKGETNGN